MPLVASARPRRVHSRNLLGAGWAWDRWLIYAKGGAAWAGDKYSAFIPVFDEQLEASETRTGWTVGGGIEWAFWSNWSAKAEYDYYDFGTRTLTLTGTFA